MSVRVDSRDVIDRLADLVEAVDFEIQHPDEPVERCECGATLLRHVEGLVFVCAGCGFTPSYWSRLSPASAGDGSVGASPAAWERGVPPETSAARFLAARKDADAPDSGVAAPTGSGVFGREGKAPRSLKLRRDRVAVGCALYLVVCYGLGAWLAVSL